MGKKSKKKKTGQALRTNKQTVSNAARASADKPVRSSGGTAAFRFDQKKRQRTAGSITVFAFAAYMFTAFPLIYHNNYIDIQITKFRAFAYAAAAFFVIWALSELCSFVSRKGRNAAAGEKITVAAKLPVIFAVILAAAVILGTVITPWRSDAMTGAAGRRMGLITWICGIAVMLILIRGHRLKKELLYVFAGGNTAVCFFAILNFWGFDPLGMYQNLVPDQRSYFISTLGNINVCAGFMCAALPVLLACIYFADGKRDQLIFGIASAAAVYTGFAASSDSFLLGCFGAFLVFLYLSLKDAEKMKRFWRVCLLFYLTVLLMKLSLMVSSDSGSAFLSVYPEDGLLGLVFSPVFLIGSALILAVLIFSERRSLPQRPELYPRIRKWLFAGLGVLLALFIILVIIANTSASAADENSTWILRRLVITDEFGSLRGYIWKRTPVVFASLSLSEKLFGCGPDCFYYAVMPLFGTEMSANFQSIFTDAHCEFLQMLITTGIFGTLGYFGILISELVLCIRNHGKGFAAFCGAAFLGSYLLQGIVNNPQIAVTPLLFVFLGIFGAALRTPETKAKSGSDRS